MSVDYTMDQYGYNIHGGYTCSIVGAAVADQVSGGPVRFVVHTEGAGVSAHAARSSSVFCWTLLNAGQPTP